jgi:hypothetical protein
MTLSQAAKTFPIAGIDRAMLRGQDDAFNTCVTFLREIQTTKSQNECHSSYGLKHIVENPPGHFDIPSSIDCYNGYIYEGTFILAALASGFTMQQYGDLNATLNIAERGLRRRAKEVATCGLTSVSHLTTLLPSSPSIEGARGVRAFNDLA